MSLRPGKNYPGSTLTIFGDFNVDCDAFDPDTSIVFKVISPSGNIQSWTFGDPDSVIQKDAVGRYACDVTPDEPGRWFYQWVVEDVEAQTAVDEGNFLVQTTRFYQGGSGAYCS